MNFDDGLRRVWFLRAMSHRVAILFACLALLPIASADAQWSRLKDDGLHDPKSPAIRDKQEPGEALGVIAEKAPDPFVGNKVRWGKALDEGAINP